MEIPRPNPVRATAVPQFLLVIRGPGMGGRVDAGGPGSWWGLLLLGGRCRDLDQCPPGTAGSGPHSAGGEWSSCSTGHLGQVQEACMAGKVGDTQETCDSNLSVSSFVTWGETRTVPRDGCQIQLLSGRDRRSMAPDTQWALLTSFPSLLLLCYSCCSH